MATLGDFTSRTMRAGDRLANRWARDLDVPEEHWLERAEAFTTELQERHNRMRTFCLGTLEHEREGA